MLKAIVEKYTVSTEDADEPLDGVDKEETEVEEVEETPEVKEETEEQVEGTEEDETEEAEESTGDTTVLEAPTDEQGEVSVAETEEVVSEIEPSDDVTEAGDDIGQEVPTDAFAGTSDTADITEGSDSGLGDDAPLDGANGTPNIEAEDAAVVENTLAEGAEVAEGQDQIVQDAIAQADGTDGGQDTDVNGNPITPEEAEENAEEERISDEIDEANTEEVEATDITGEETPLEEAEALTEEMAAETEENAEESTDDSFSETGDTGGDSTDTSGSDEFGGSMDSEDDLLDDDTPLEGAEEVTETSTEDGDVVDTEVTEGDTTDIQESVDDQNKAADVTAEAASSDVNDTDTIKGDAVAEDDKEIPLDVDVDDSFKQKEVDGNPSYSDNHQDDTAATVEETIDNPDGTEESLASAIADDAAAGNDEITEAIDETETEDESNGVDANTEIEQSQDEMSNGVDDVEQSDQSGDAVDDVTGEADFEEGEVDIPDVDMDTTDDEVAEAFNEADDTEVEADKDETEAIDATKTIEELQKEAESLESYVKQLDDAIANESYDARFIAHMQVELGKRASAWGDQGPVVPSIEDYGHGDLDLLYKASVESFRGFWSRTMHLSVRLRDQLQRWWNSPMVTKVVKRSEAVNKAVDKALIDLKASEFNSGDVKGISGYLSTDNASLVKAVSDDLKYTTGIATKGLKANEKLTGDIVKMIDDIVSARKPADIKKVLGQVDSLKSVKQAYPGEVFTEGRLFGGWVLEFKEGSIGDSGIPVAVKQKSGDRKTSFKLTKADLSNLLLMAKTYAAVAKKAAETVGDKAVEEIPAILHQQHRALPISDQSRILGEWGDEKKIDELVDGMMKLSKAHHDVYKFIVKHCLDVAEAIISVVNKAI